MTISKILEQKKTLLSFEVFPPKQQANFENTVNAAKELCNLNPDFISVTYGAGGTTRENTVEIASKILSFGTPALAHLTCVGNTIDEAKNIISQMKKNKIENVLALRGDIPQGIPNPLSNELDHANVLAKILKDEGFCVGGACYPEGHPESHNRQEDIDNLKYKIDAGVDFLTTQMFFDNNMLYSYLYQIQSKGIYVYQYQDDVVAAVVACITGSGYSRNYANYKQQSSFKNGKTFICVYSGQTPFNLRPLF